MFFLPVTKTTSQEIKLLNSYGVPLKNKSVLIHHHHTDTLKTNRKGIIKILYFADVGPYLENSIKSLTSSTPVLLAASISNTSI